MTPTEIQVGRRTVLKAAGATVAGGLLAGCSTETEQESGGSSGGNGDGSSGGEQMTESFGGWLENTDNYDGVVDETGQSEVTVDVGVAGNGDNFAFGPAAIRVDAGTTVTWEWTGEGGSHNVVADDGAFESELTDEAGFTFEQTVEETGRIKYYCSPHQTVGMKGVVVVA